MPGLSAEVDAGFEISLGEKDWKKFGSLLKAETDRKSWIPFRQVTAGQTDSNGNAVFQVIDRVPTGYGLRITSIIQQAQGFTPATVFSNAAAWFAYYRNSVAVGNIVDLGPTIASGTVFPNKKDYSNDSDPVLVGGESLWFQLAGSVGAIANGVSITITVFGILSLLTDLGYIYD